ncbi:hypothetical protein D3C77_369820 [compost metagenome]
MMSQGASHPITLLTASSNSCPWCGGKLTTLLELAVNHPSLQFLSLSGEKFKVETCVICSCYDVVYMDVSLSGEPTWSTYNKKPDYLPEIDLDDYDDGYLTVSHLFRLSAKPRNSYHAAHWTLNSTNSQVGGHPSWIQDAYYPDCPCCSNHMTFIGQLDWEEVEEQGEGIYYMFVCPDCLITATIFQQT